MPTLDYVAVSEKLIARRVAWVSAARLGSLAAWFATTTIAAETIGPSGFAVYYLVQVAVRIASEFVGEPLDAGVMRDVPVAPVADRLAMFWAAMWLRTVAGLVVMVAVVAAPVAASGLIFNRPDARGLAVLAAAGVWGDLVLRGVLGFLQATERFKPFVVVDLVWQLGRVLVVAALVVTSRLTTTNLIAIYVVTPYVASVVGFFLIGSTPQWPERATVARLLRYVRWIAVGLGVGALLERTDVWLLSRFRGPVDVGVYGIAMFLASIPDYLSGIVQTAITPRVPVAIAGGSLGALSRRFWAVAVPVGIVMTVTAVLIPGKIMPAVLPKFTAAVPAFRVLVLMSIVSLTVTPIATAAVNFAAPRAATAISVVGLMTVTIVGLVAIPAHGLIGAAVAMVAAKVVVALMTMVAARRVDRRDRGPTRPA